ncbi:MAG: hypothetical protein IPG23_25310 [Burkholderiales bacterium]|nr:hypothetical protein [Burkholderiales bacterium]
MKPHHAAEALRALCKSGLHPDVLVPAFLEALHAVVPSYRNLFDWTDAQGRLVRYYIEGPIDTAVAQLYFDAFHNKLEAAAMPMFDSLQANKRRECAAPKNCNIWHSMVPRFIPKSGGPKVFTPAWRLSFVARAAS